MPNPVRCAAPRRAAWLLTLLALLWSGGAEAALTYNLSSPLKQGLCSNDTDGDCLDNGQETNLAWAVSPWYFYDEDEECSGWTNKYGLPSSHFARRDYVQVRPHGKGVREWSTTDGVGKWVTVTFFFLYPHDCGGNFGFAGHQGDSERVQFHLYSYDLTTWYLSSAAYDHHGRTDSVSGSTLQQHATTLGTSWASVAADEDKHGSWPGREPGSSHCAGSMDDFCYGTCDCFVGTWSSDFRNGYYDVPSASRNVGGPAPEQWNPTYVTVSGTTAYTVLDVGHGANREYWTPRSDAYRYFCGWQCPAAYRQSDGHCALSIHGESGCAEGPLSTKVDTYPFTVSGTSCTGACGGYAGACWCDAACVSAGDCCADACALCGYCGATAGATFAALVDGGSRRPGFAPRPEDGPRAARARRAAADAAERLRRWAGEDGAVRDDEQRVYAARAADPVAALVPMLLHAPPDHQLETLRWALTVPDALRLAALFDDLHGLPRARREEAARERALDLVALLEAEGIEAPTLAPGFVLAESVEAVLAPEPPPESWR